MNTELSEVVCPCIHAQAAQEHHEQQLTVWLDMLDSRQLYSVLKAAEIVCPAVQAEGEEQEEQEEQQIRGARQQQQVSRQPVFVLDEETLLLSYVMNGRRYAANVTEQGFLHCCSCPHDSALSCVHVKALREYIVFWGEFYAWKGNKCNLKAVFDHLRTLDISKVTNMQALFRSHVTTAAEEASMASADVLTQWIVQKVQEYIKARDDAPCEEAKPPAISTHTSDKLFADFEEWGLKSRFWNTGDKPPYNFYKFSGLLNERYGKKWGESVALEKVGNIGPSKKNGYMIMLYSPS